MKIKYKVLNLTCRISVNDMFKCLKLYIEVLKVTCKVLEMIC